MDWDAAIEKHREALKTVLAGLLVMAGFVGGAPDTRGGRPATLPRHLHRAVLRLLRPAEAAVRRLVIVVARGVAVCLPPLRPRGHKRKRPHATGAAIGFALFDPPSRWGRSRRRPAQICIPRIAFPGVTALSPVRLAPMPTDPIDTTPLSRRLAALGCVLDNLPQQAQRFARWQARKLQASLLQQKSGAGVPARIRRVWPLRPDRPAGQHRARGRRPAHAVHGILTDLHGLALWALEPADTS